MEGAGSLGDRGHDLRHNQVARKRGDRSEVDRYQL